jgi:hypothetical protein
MPGISPPELPSSVGTIYLDEYWDGEWGIADRSGHLVADGMQWEDMGSFAEGLCSVRRNGKWGFVDRAGKLVIEPQWKMVDSFSEGACFVMGEEGMGYIGKDGGFILRGDWEWASPVEHGTVLVKEKDTGKPSYIRMLYEEN